MCRPFIGSMETLHDIRVNYQMDSHHASPGLEERYSTRGQIYVARGWKIELNSWSSCPLTPGAKEKYLTQVNY